MRQDIIEGFCRDGVCFRGGICFEGERCAFLLVPENGISLLISREYAALLREGRCPDGLLGKMLARGMAQAETAPPVLDISRMTAPNFFLIDLTQACNYSCKYCLRNPESEGRRMSAEMLDRILDRILELCETHHYTHISIQPWGGEPLLEFDKILHICERMKTSGIAVNISLETNGSRITEEIATKLVEEKICVGISIDGPEAIHDAQRVTNAGAPTFAEVTRGIRRLQEAGMKDIGSITVVTRQSLEHMEEILDFFGSEYPDMGIKLNPMHSPGKAEAIPMALTVEDMPRFAGILVEKVKEAYREGRVLHEARTVTTLRNLLCRFDSDICHSHGCRGGHCMVIFDQNGDVFPCEMVDYPEERLMNVSEDRDLKEAIEAAAGTNEYFKEKEAEECRTCPWRYYCRGGCTSAVMYKKGKNEGIDEEGCALNREMYLKLVDMIVDEPELAFAVMEGRVYEGEKTNETPVFCADGPV